MIKVFLCILKKSYPCDLNQWWNNLKATYIFISIVTIIRAPLIRIYHTRTIYSKFFIIYIITYLFFYNILSRFLAEKIPYGDRIQTGPHWVNCVWVL